METFICAMKPEDWEEVRAIYLEGIATGHATFEPGAPDWEKWDSSHVRRPSPRSPGRRPGCRVGRFEPGFRPTSLRGSCRSQHLRGKELSREGHWATLFWGLSCPLRKKKVSGRSRRASSRKMSPASSCTRNTGSGCSAFGRGSERWPLGSFGGNGGMSSSWSGGAKSRG